MLVRTMWTKRSLFYRVVHRVDGLLLQRAWVCGRRGGVRRALGTTNRWWRPWRFFAGPEPARVCRSRNVLVGQQAASALTTAAQGGCPILVRRTADGRPGRLYFWHEQA